MDSGVGRNSGILLTPIAQLDSHISQTWCRVPTDLASVRYGDFGPPDDADAVEV